MGTLGQKPEHGIVGIGLIQRDALVLSDVFPPVGDHFSADGYGDFRRSLGVDFQADGGVDALKRFRGEPFLCQKVEQTLHPALGTDHAQITGQRP